MRKLAAWILVLVLLAGTLTGCGSDSLGLSPQVIQCADLTVTLPGHFLDLGDKDYARGLPFVYGFGNTAVMGLKEPRSVLDPYLDACSADAYAKLFLEVNKLDVPVEEQDGLTLFRYTQQTQDVQIAYLCAAYMGKDNYWIIQTYCAQEDMKKLEKDFLEILRSGR